MCAAPPPASDCIKKVKKRDSGCWSCPLWTGFTRTHPLRACLKTYSPHLHSSLSIMYSEYASVRCRAPGSSGFLISPSVLYLSEALSEGQNHIRPNEKAIVDPFLHLVPLDSFSPRKHLSLFVLPEAYETIRVHLCPEENSPALSKAVLFSTRPRQPEFRKAFGRL